MHQPATTTAYEYNNETSPFMNRYESVQRPEKRRRLLRFVFSAMSNLRVYESCKVKTKQIAARPSGRTWRWRKLASVSNGEDNVGPQEIPLNEECVVTKFSPPKIDMQIVIIFAPYQPFRNRGTRCGWFELFYTTTRRSSPDLIRAVPFQ